MNAFVTIFYDWSRAIASLFSWLAPLAVRITVGVVFMGTGWTKLHNLPAITKNFTALGIPAPEILTPFVSGVEFVGGLLLLVGLLTRFAAVPLMIVMVVAIVSAKLGDIDSLETFLGFEEVSYFVMFAWLAIAGPGPVSIDHFILQAAGRKPREHGA
jgi:putative oxidoreductase